MFQINHLRWLSANAVIVLVFILLFVKLNTYPNTLYNWENYSLASIFHYRFSDTKITLEKYLDATDGLMTDSGDTLATGLPMYLITKQFGYELGWMRVWSAGLSLLGIISFFLLMTKVFGHRISTLATFFFGTSQAFLLYGRTATNVGPTLLMEMLSVSVIYYFLKKTDSLKLLITSVILILVNYYFYAPIRFFTPILLLLIGRLLWLKFSSLVSKHQPLFLTKRKSRLLAAGLLCIFSLIISIHFKTQILDYYFARGEHLFANISYQPLAQTLNQKMFFTVLQNAWLYLKMLFSLDARPVIVDFGNYYGQMINHFLVPFFVIGFVMTLNKVNKSNSKYFLLLIWFILTGLPIILTNNVHIGRLFLNLAPMYVIVAIGLNHTVNILTNYISNFNIRGKIWLKTMSLIIVTFLCVAISLNELKNYFFIPPTIDHNIKVLEENLDSFQDKKIYLINAESDLLHFWEIFFYLKNSVEFTNVQTLQPFDDNGADEILTTVCQDFNSALIIIGTKNAPFSPEDSINCLATTIFLYQ